LIAGMPAPSVEVVRLGLRGLLPWQTVWEFNPTRAGGYSDYVDKLKAMFSPPTGRSDDSVHYIRDALLPCRSIEEVRTLLFDRERQANGDTAEFDRGFPKYKPTPLTEDDDWRLESEATASVSVPDKPKSSAIPNRYLVRGDERARVLTCVDAPMVMVRAKRGIAIPAKQARNHPPGTIFLDGAAQGEPFVDF
jgi:hypothetical protein